MIERFSIVKSLDFNKLDTNILIYEATTGNEPYLFMNEETIRAVFNEYEKAFITKEFFEELSRYEKAGTYKGYKLFPNEDLEFGEVEIR